MQRVERQSLTRKHLEWLKGRHATRSLSLLSLHSLSVRAPSLTICCPATTRECAMATFSFGQSALSSRLSPSKLADTWSLQGHPPLRLLPRRNPPPLVSEPGALPRTRESVPAHWLRSLRLRRRRSNAIAVWSVDRTSSVGSTSNYYISVRSRTRHCPIDRSLWRVNRSLVRRTVWIHGDRTTLGTLWCRSRTTTATTTTADGPSAVWAVSIRRDRFAVRKLVRSVLSPSADERPADP
mgnify:CR=1 FL=1